MVWNRINGRKEENRPNSNRDDNHNDGTKLEEKIIIWWLVVVNLHDPQLFSSIQEILDNDVTVATRAFVFIPPE